jgi:hypothetical protein
MAQIVGQSLKICMHHQLLKKRANWSCLASDYLEVKPRFLIECCGNKRKQFAVGCLRRWPGRTNGLMKQSLRFDFMRIMQAREQ